MSVIGSLVFTAGGIYLLVRNRSIVDLVVGAAVLVLFAPTAPIAARLLRKDDRVLTISDEGLDAPTLGTIPWSEILALRIDDQGLDLKTRRGELQVSSRRMNLTPKDLRDEIAAHSGGSWFSGQWTGRAS